MYLEGVEDMDKDKTIDLHIKFKTDDMINNGFAIHLIGLLPYFHNSMCEFDMKTYPYTLKNISIHDAENLSLMYNLLKNRTVTYLDRYFEELEEKITDAVYDVI